MATFIVNVEQKKITPFVVEAENEWEAMIKAKEGEGYIHESGSMDLEIEPTSWSVDSYSDSYLNHFYD